MTITLKEARKLGYEINRGSYTGTTDDRLDRWYVDRVDAGYLDRRGPGYATRAAALEALSEILEFQRGSEE